MISTAFTLVLAGVAAAVPFSTQGYAPVSHSKGITFVMNVTDPSTDFKDTPVNGLQLVGVHAGATENAPTVTSNGGESFFATNNDTIQLANTGSTPYSIFMDETAVEPFVYNLGINAGYGTPGFGITSGPLNPHPCPMLYAPKAGTFAVCDTGFGAPTHPQLLVQFVEGSMSNWYASENVPANCVAVKLIPQCSAIDPNQATVNYDDIPESQCYDNVTAINWSQLSPCW